MLASITALGEAVNLYAEACVLVDSLRARLRRVAAAVAAQERPRVLLLQGLDPLQVGGHWAFEMVTLAGGSEGLQKGWKLWTDMELEFGLVFALDSASFSSLSMVGILSPGAVRVKRAVP